MSAPQQQYERISAFDLRDQISNNAIQVVDVREEDFELGHVKGAVNVPVDKFLASNNNEFLDSLLEEHSSKTALVFHCFKSQKRGPRAAEILLSRAQERGLQKPEIKVLDGGYEKWEELFQGNEDLIAKGK